MLVGRNLEVMDWVAMAWVAKPWGYLVQHVSCDGF